MEGRDTTRGDCRRGVQRRICSCWRSSGVHPTPGVALRLALASPGGREARPSWCTCWPSPNRDGSGRQVPLWASNDRRGPRRVSPVGREACPTLVPTLLRPTPRVARRRALRGGDRLALVGRPTPGVARGGLSGGGGLFSSRAGWPLGLPGPQRRGFRRPRGAVVCVDTQP
jgi:hypothetical protein